MAREIDQIQSVRQPRLSHLDCLITIITNTTLMGLELGGMTAQVV
jgi:hypothetical protein